VQWKTLFIPFFSCSTAVSVPTRNTSRKALSSLNPAYRTRVLAAITRAHVDMAPNKHTSKMINRSRYPILWPACTVSCFSDGSGKASEERTLETMTLLGLNMSNKAKPIPTTDAGSCMWKGKSIAITNRTARWIT